MKILFFVILPSFLFGQSMLVNGEIKDHLNNPIEAVSIAINNQFLLTNEKGQYAVSVPKKDSVKVDISHLSFNDTSITLYGDNIAWSSIALTSYSESLDEVTVQSLRVKTLSSQISDKVSIEYHIDPDDYFSLNGSTHLTEMLKHIGGVREQVGCGICFTSSIRLNGLEGEQTAIMIDNIPIYGSLSSIYGLNSIPSSMIDRVEIAKGSNSSEFGADGIAGTINIITKNYDRNTPLTIHARLNSHLQGDISITGSYAIGPIQTLSSFNYSRNNTFFDDNNDLFADEALFDRLSFFTKFSTSINKLDQSLFIKYYYEDRRNGTSEYLKENNYSIFRGSNQIYGESIYTHRIELIGKSALSSIVPLTLYYNGSAHLQDSYYGDTYFGANQYTASVHVSLKKLFSNHSLQAVLSYRLQYNDQDISTIQDANGLLSGPIHIPGIYIRHLWLVKNNISLSSGVRFDYYFDHGCIPTPRFHFKYSPSPSTNVRLNIGTGFRIVNLLTEEHAFLSTNRTLIIDDEIKPERSINASVQFDHSFTFAKQQVHLNTELSYTHFTNPIFPDYSSVNEIRYQNERTSSNHLGIQVQYAHYFHFPLQLELNYQFLYARLHTPSTNRSQGVEIEFIPAHEANLIARIELQKWDADISYRMNLTGPMRLPLVNDKMEMSGEWESRPTMSPLITIHSIQFNKHLHKQHLDLYVGIENIFNYRQTYSPISGVDPSQVLGFSNTFDTNYSFAPVNGIYGYIGLKWTLRN